VLRQGWRAGSVGYCRTSTAQPMPGHCSGFAGGMEKFDELLLAGGPTLEPRLAQTPGPAALAAGRIPRIDLREPAGRGPGFFETAAKHKHLAAAE
jgi:hypothetical protein